MRWADMKDDCIEEILGPWAQTDAQRTDIIGYRQTNLSHPNRGEKGIYTMPDISEDMDIYWNTESYRY